MSYRIVIPARLASQRLPDKPLVQIAPAPRRRIGTEARGGVGPGRQVGHAGVLGAVPGAAFGHWGQNGCGQNGMSSSA